MTKFTADDIVWTDWIEDRVEHSTGLYYDVLKCEGSIPKASNDQGQMPGAAIQIDAALVALDARGREAALSEAREGYNEALLELANDGR